MELMKGLLFGLIISFPFLSQGFTITHAPPIVFPNNEITVDISEGECGEHSWATPEKLMDYVNGAIGRYWNTVATSALDLTVGQFISRDLSLLQFQDFKKSNLSTTLESKLKQGKILVGCNDLAQNGFLEVREPEGLFVDLGLRSTIVAVSNIYSKGGGRVFGIVLFNSKANLNDDHNIEAYMAHELGHAVGLGHSEKPSALMYYKAGHHVQEKLTLDDWDGASYLYPLDTVFPPSCGTIGQGPSQKAPLMGGGLLLGLLLALVLGAKGPRPKTIHRPWGQKE